MSLEDVLMDAAEEVYDQEVSKSRSKKILQKSFSDDYKMIASMMMKITIKIDLQLIMMKF
jgi:hypothetical protein